MTDAPTNPDDKAAADFARPVLDRQLARLEELADIGMEIARDLSRRVAEAAEPGGEAMDPAAVTLAYNRVSRAVRMTCALQTEVLDKLRGVGRIETYDAALAAQDAARTAARDALEKRRRARKLEVAEGVAEAIDEAHETTEGRERCVREAKERLRDTDDLGDILSRPVDEVIAQICRELGIARGLASLHSVHPDAPRSGGAQRPPRGPGFLRSAAVRPDPTPPEPEPENAWVPASPEVNQGSEPQPDPDALPGYPVGLPGELPPVRPRRRPYWQS